MSTAVITREEAIEVGLDRYWPGTPCASGHVGEHYVVNRACVECNAGKLTPAQFAYLFGPAIGDGDPVRKRVTTWVEWEAFYTNWIVRREASVADEVIVEKTVRGGRRHGANHRFKVSMVHHARASRSVSAPSREVPA